jgi:Ca-activated chloride channel family protein
VNAAVSGGAGKTPGWIRWAGISRLSTMCLLLDNSGSMETKRAAVWAAALALMKSSQPHDEVGVFNFNDEAFNGLPNGKDFTSDVRKMKEALTHIDARGGSAMRGAIRVAPSDYHLTAHSEMNREVVILSNMFWDNADFKYARPQFTGDKQSLLI